METLMFDFSSYYDRIAKELPNDCKVLECGVANGDSALFLAQKLHDYGKKFKLYMVDSMDYGKYIQICTIYENIIKSGLGANIEVVPFESLEAAEKFNDGYFDFVFIDSSHEYNSTKKEIPAWFRKIKDEGILAGHDYNAPEVKQAVDETIPTYFVRTDIADRTFDPEKVLHTENTNNGWGLWWCRKQWYLKLKNKI